MPDPQPTPEITHQAPIPEELRIQLEGFKKKLWRIKITEAILAGVFGVIFSFLVVFLLDRIIETPQTVRLCILILGASLFAVFAPYWIHRWVYGHRYENQLARLISKKFPHLGDRLLGAVELQDQTGNKESLSPELRFAAMQDVAKDISDRDLTKALPKSRHCKWALAVIGMFIITAVTVASFPEARNNSLKRWLLPLSNTPRYTFTQLDLSGIENPKYVAYGEPFSLNIPLDKNTIRSPKIARARYGNDNSSGEWIESPLSNNSYTFEIPGQRAEGDLHLEANDAIHSLLIKPIIRPSLQSVRASIQLPAYLERPDVIADLRSGFMTALEGSQMTIKATASRALKSAHAEVVTIIEEPADFEKTPSTIKPAEIEPSALKLTLKENLITSDPLLIERNAITIPISWSGIYGLETDKPLRLRIESIQDQSPSTFIQGVERQHIMLAEEVINFTVLANDDYGLKACGIEWLGDPARVDQAGTATGELNLGKGSPTQTDLNIPFSFSPANMDIQPQKLTLRSWAEDYNPERGKVYSQPITLYILTADEHAQVLKDDFDRIIGDLEEIAREEQNLNDENLRFERKDGKNLQSEAAKKKLQEQQDAEQQNKERMEKLTEDMEKLFKDAVRNGDIDKETLKKMAQSLQSMKELSTKDLPKVEQKLKDAQKQSNSEEKSEQDLKEAIEEQKKAIEKMKQALKEANEANKQFEAGTFINRLKRAASDENNIAGTFISMINKIIGSSYDKLDPVEQRAVKALHLQQLQTAADIRWIQEDLTHYFQRTAKEEHQVLAEKMEQSGINESLEELTKDVAKNLSYQSIDSSKRWADQLNAWAKDLKDSSESGGEGGEGGSPPPADKNFEFMLKVMRMIQSEQDIRGRTRALEDLYRALKADKEAPSNNS
ncbi:hypothetical protein OAI07_00290 [Akkermansiaceae bacterium]|nr:hypothetical protein [Akkermansiaceae bacterium]